MLILASLAAWFLLVIVGLIALIKRTGADGELAAKVCAPLGMWFLSPVSLPLYGAWRILRLGEHRVAEYRGLVKSGSFRRAA